MVEKDLNMKRVFNNLLRILVVVSVFVWVIGNLAEHRHDTPAYKIMTMNEDLKYEY